MPKKSMLPTAAGIAAVSLAAGAAAYAMNARSMRGTRRKMKKTANQAARALGGAVSNVVDSVSSSLLQ